MITLKVLLMVAWLTMLTYAFCVFLAWIGRGLWYVVERVLCLVVDVPWADYRQAKTIELEWSDDDNEP